ncbi:recombinase family protein [Emcibacter nanhaiensis]|uniref:Resolvase n=1 Tax=Emcibacter nanhaiensis TaxID=1505037 RepID=A0A501PRF7_9PROT|nr:recombinase family protein [Emcibacter nanhaiensis]TPD63033.1 resolvase [Emcibacter nanhaiensis]
MTKRVALYLRVSTAEQTTENQRLELEAICKRQGWVIVEVYEDAGISGAKGRDKRPAYDAMLKDASRRKFDMIMAWSIDRLGRSLQQLVVFLEELKSLDIDLYLDRQGIDTRTPTGKAMFQMCGVFAEFERSMIQERVKAGLDRAKANGTTLGRPRINQEKEARIIQLREQGASFRKIAGEIGCGISAVQRVLQKAS